MKSQSETVLYDLVCVIKKTWDGDMISHEVVSIDNVTYTGFTIYLLVEKKKTFFIPPYLFTEVTSSP